MLITFRTVRFRNFMSYGNIWTDVELDKPGTTLIVGEDLDNTTNGQSANGTGKSTIINALVYGLYDRAVSNINKDNLINNINKKHMEVAVTFCVDGVEYEVIRRRKMKVGAEGNTVHLYENGKDITLDSAATNKKIESILGVPYELFVRIVVFSASHVPFLDLKAKSHYEANQTDFIEELFGLTTLSHKAEQLKAVIKSTEMSLETKRSAITLHEQARERHEGQLESAKRRVVTWEQTTADSIEAIASKLSKVEHVDVSGQQLLHSQFNELNKQRGDIKNIIKTLTRDLTTATTNVDDIGSEIAHLESDECPYCHQSYPESADKLAECKTKHEALTARIAELSESIRVEREKLDNITTLIEDVESEITVSNVDELLQILSQTENLKNKISELSTSTNPYLEPLEELENMRLEEIDYSELNETSKLVDHQKFLLKLLTKKDSFVRKALLDKNIPYLNSRLRTYLDTLGLPHTVSFTQEMTASISRFGTPLDFGNLSAGQRARVNLALSFAFRDVLQNLHSRINVCMLDEVLDIGLDAVGVQSAVKLLKLKAREEQMSMFIISHKEEVATGAFDRCITARIHKGFSSIVSEEDSGAE